MKKINTRGLAFMAILIALVIVLWNIISISTPLLHISLSFIPKMLMGMFFGPFWSAIGELIADLLGNTLFSSSTFFIGFTLNKVVEGILYGYFFYKKSASLKNIIECVMSITLLVNLILSPIWLLIMYGIPLNSLTLWIPRIVKEMIYMPIQIVIMLVIVKNMPMRVIKNMLFKEQ